jgi:hypothetical protein
MESKTKPQIPLKVDIVYNEQQELLDLVEQEEFVTFMYEGAIAALKQAIRKNKSECVIFDIINYNFKVVLKKDHYKSFLNKAIKHYESIENYPLCSELVTLKSRL